MTDDNRLILIECYRSGQISEAAWQEHLAADPELRDMVERPVAGGTRRPTILDMDLVVVPQAMTDEEIARWIDACNHGPAKDALRHYVSVRAVATAWDDVRKYVEGLEEKVAFTMTDASRMLRKSDIKDVCPHPDDCFYELERARCGPCAVKASKLAGIEIDDTHSHLPEVCRLRREVKAAEARIAELEADHLDERLAMSGRIQFLEDASAVPHLERRIADLEAALDEKEVASGLTDNGNLWRFWAMKASAVAVRNAELEKRLADAERVIEPFAALPDAPHGKRSYFLELLVRPEGDDPADGVKHYGPAIRAARAYMEGK